MGGLVGLLEVVEEEGRMIGRRLIPTTPATLTPATATATPAITTATTIRMVEVVGI